MDMFEIIAFIIITLIICGIIGFGLYLYYDFIEHRKNLETDLVKSSIDLNYNFNTTSSNIDSVSKSLSKSIDDNRVLIYGYSNTINKLDSFTSNTSNLLTNKYMSMSMQTNNDFDNFDRNLSKYFTFKDGNDNIMTHDGPNNKIYNYIFGTNIPNIELISQTTAISGMTINSDINKEFQICSSESPDKCVKMSTNVDGEFTIAPDGANNIVFKNNNGGTMANFDSINNAIYFGSDTENTAKMYVKDNDLYVSSLNIISNNGKNVSNLYNFDNEKYSPIYTKCEIKNTPNGSTNVNTDITITLNFLKQRDLSTYNSIYINIPYIKISDFKEIDFNIKQNSILPKDAVTKNNNIDLILKDTKSLVDSVTNELSKNISFDKNNMKVTINNTNQPILKESYALEIIIKTENIPNFTTLSNNITYSFVTNSYFAE